MNANKQTVTVIDYEQEGDYFNCEVVNRDTCLIEHVKIDAQYMGNMYPDTDMLEDLPYDMCGLVFETVAGKHLAGAPQPA